MAVPKQRTGRMSTHHRRSANDRVDAPAKCTCPKCGHAKLPHHVCPNCGTYKDREVIVTE
ncbi:50S ribosomal protein L32 [Phoenicibacter congonensis]|uniref:50S ribosomal protein L32 n=1 Tax=Phoenicibacter congonensis TaxID=1944646 RepID=UPI0009A7896A|nr:50S ribosomal protein L32 [Phoenicibacter congonensis]